MSCICSQNWKPMPMSSVLLLPNVASCAGCPGCCHCCQRLLLPGHLWKNGIFKKEKSESRLIWWTAVLCSDHVFYVLACFALCVISLAATKQNIMKKHEYSIWPELFLGITTKQETNSKIKASLTWKLVLFTFIYL